MKAFEGRKNVSVPYSMKSAECGAPEKPMDITDTAVIGAISGKSHSIEMANQLSNYVLGRRELLSDVFSQYRAGGEPFVQTLLTGRLAKKVGLTQALRLCKPEVVKQMLGMLRRKMKEAAG